MSKRNAAITWGIAIGTMLIAAAAGVLLSKGVAEVLLACGIAVICVTAWMALNAAPEHAKDYPRVTLEFSDEPLKFNARNRWVGDRPIYVKNVGRSAAFDVQIENIDTTFAIAEFPKVPVLEPGKRCRVRPEITETSNLRPGTTGISEFEMMLQDKCAVGGWNGAEESVRITYRDALGSDLVTNLVAKYDVGGLTVATDLNFDPKASEDK